MSRWILPGLWALFLMCVVLVCFAAHGYAAQEGHDGQFAPEFHEPSDSGYEIPGLSFRLFVDRGTKETVCGSLDETEGNAALRTVIDTFFLSESTSTHLSTVR